MSEHTKDAHAAVDNFGGLDGQGYFGIYDGHAGKQVADYCGKHLHEVAPLSLF